MFIVDAAIAAARKLSSDVQELSFSAPVTHVYNPLNYAWDAHEAYIRLMNPNGSRVLFLGMNPGPWGMAQTGIPFGQVSVVRDWLCIQATIKQPEKLHPKRPIEGLECKRSEVSGERLWGLFRQRYITTNRFFEQHFVANYCPLVFMEESARNRTPDKLPAKERQQLSLICDQHLLDLIHALQPEWLVGIGAYAEQCFRRVAPEHQQVVRILHPSPASPSANRGWAAVVTDQLIAAGVWRK